MKPSDRLVARLRALEESLWRTETRFDRTAMEALFAPDFYEIGRSGRLHSRDACLAMPPEPIEIVLPLPDFAVRLLTPEVALVTYSSFVTYDGVVQKGRRSSIWSGGETDWRLRFHQGTPFPEDGEDPS